jgi:chromosome segregation ATPase
VKDLRYQLSEYEKLLGTEQLQDCKNRVADKKKKLADLGDRIGKLKDGIKELEDKVKEAIKEMNPESSKCPKMKALLDELAALKKEVGKLEAEKEKQETDLNNFEKKLDAVDPEKVNLNNMADLMGEMKKLDDNFDNLEERVEAAENKLDDLNNRYNDLEDRIKLDKRHEAGKAIKETQSHLDELIRKLKNIDSQLTMIDKETDHLNDEFKDKEKTDELTNFDKKVGEKKDSHATKSGQKDNYQQRIKDLEKLYEEQDPDNTELSQWNVIIGKAKAIDKEINQTLEKANILEKDACDTKKDAVKMVEKYTEKKGLYGDCIKGKDQANQSIGTLKDTLDDMEERANKLDEELKNSRVPESEKAQYDKYKKLCDRVTAMKKQIADKVKMVANLEDKLNKLVKDLPNIEDKKITTAELKKIKEELDKFNGELSQLIDDVSELNDHLKELEGDVDDLVKKYRGDKLMEVDRKLNEAFSGVEKLEKRLKEVMGKIADFEVVLNDANNDPEEVERVELIQKLLGEVGELMDECKKIVKDKDNIKKVLEGIKAKLSEQNSGDVSMDMINELIADIAACDSKVAKNLKDLDRIEEDLDKKKADFDKFLGKSGERGGLIDDINHMLDDCN